jgi:hypothetical protein
MKYSRCNSVAENCPSLSRPHTPHWETDNAAADVVAVVSDSLTPPALPIRQHKRLSTPVER